MCVIERESMCVCVKEREECVCACVCVRERVCALAYLGDGGDEGDRVEEPRQPHARREAEVALGPDLELLLALEDVGVPEGKDEGGTKERE